MNYIGYRVQIPRFRRRNYVDPLGEFAFTDVAGMRLFADLTDLTKTFQDALKTTPAVSDGDVLGAIEDKSGQGNDVLQSTTANKPSLELNELNGLSIGRGNGTTDVMHSLATGAIAQPNTMWLVAKNLDVPPVGQKIFFDGLVTREFLFMISASDNWGFFANNVVDSGDSADNLWHIFTVIFNGASSELYLDGVLIGAGDAGAAAIDGFSLFASNAGSNEADVDIAMAMLYDSLLSDVNLNLIGNLISDLTTISWTDI